jgi:signal transduction histidine kinase
MLVLGLAYGLLAASLRTRDREVVQATLLRYGSAYASRGLGALEAAVATDRAAGRYEPLFVRVLTPGGREASFFSMPDSWGQFDLRQLSAPALLGAQQWAQLSAPGSDERLDVLSVMLPDGSLFQIGKSTASRDELLARFRGTAAVLVLFVIAIAVAGGATLTWSALRPLRNLTRGVQDILQTGNLRARVTVDGSGDPLDDASALMNRMLDRIEALIAGLRGSLDNVAHDLRTPLTRLRATAETALRDSPTPEAYRAALADCLEEAQQVTTILDALMDIAEAETGVMTLHRHPVDLVPVLASAVDLYEDIAEQQGIELDVALPSRLEAVADPARIRQVVANLLDNAIKYSPPGASVRLAAESSPDGAWIRVSDTGPGIDPGDLPHIWNRLYRGDRSRSKRGLGLGLSLVKAIVEAHDGRVAVESRPGEGARVSVRLPAPSRT